MRIALLMTVVCAVATPAVAQPHVTHWGMTGTFTPRWTSPDTFDDLYEFTPSDVKGWDFRVGIVRGKMAGGEWGVSLIHKRISNDSTMGDFTERCELQECYPEGDTYTFSDASWTGAMVHVFLPFATIHRTVQFGVSLGAGAAGVSGDATVESRRLSYTALSERFVRFHRDANGQVIAEETTSTIPAKDLVKNNPMPLVDAQLSVSANVAPGVKLRASGGLSLPGFQPVSISLVYLFGPK